MKPVSWRKWIPGNGKLGIHPFGQENTDRVNCGKRASELRHLAISQYAQLSDISEQT
jgi:hypothetical protein